MDFKSAMKALKESKKATQDTKYVKYSDIITQKISENKKDDITKKFDEIEKEKEDWNKMRQANLNKQKEAEMRINKLDEIEKQNEEKDELNVNIQDNDQNILNEIASEDLEEFNLNICNKEWILNVDSSTLIEEVNEQGEIKRFVQPDKFTTEFKCEELYKWFHKMFQEWERDLDVIYILIIISL